jgi:hypothetical protein
VSTKEGAAEQRYTSIPVPPRPPTQAEECARWLLEVMEQAGGPAKPKEIVRLAKESGFGRATCVRLCLVCGAERRDARSHGGPWERGSESFGGGSGDPPRAPGAYARLGRGAVDLVWPS